MADTNNTKLFKAGIESLCQAGSPIIEIDKATYSNDEEVISSEKSKYISNPDYEVGLAIDPDALNEDQKNRLIKEFNTLNNKNKISRVNNLETNNQINTTWEEAANGFSNQSSAYEGTMGTISSAASIAASVFDSVAGATSDFINTLYNSGASVLDDIISAIGANGNTSGVTSFFKGALSVLSNNMKDYKDGVSETNFGSMMENSWIGDNTRSFLNYFSKGNSSYTINLMKSTPLDPGDQRENLYGSLMLGTPYLFNSGADPLNRTLVNTIIKDSRFLTLTPGMPKYNGTSYSQSKKDNILYQTETPESMLRYLLNNGIDKNFSEKDKRYYTFETNYTEYFKYLETMLNAIWIKLGLAKNGNEFNLMTFFDIKTQYDSANVATADSLLSKYNSSIGYFVNGVGGINESLTNDRTTFGSELEGKANSLSDEFQKINFMTGMGTGSKLKNASRKIAIGMQTGSAIKGEFTDAYSNTISAIGDVKNANGIAGTLLAIAKIGVNAVLDTTKFNATQDIGTLVQQFATTNGMKLKYPELWSDSAYSKAVNFNFSFVSPYGDPLSIFKYVYVPFCSLLCFAMPRQAAENGYVSPFFVRADIPGLFTSDLAMIADMSWVKGGGAGLFTKDGLPRAIDVSLTIDDLYPYLAMTKRLSYLSANPSYSIFLDSFTGMLALNKVDDSEDGLNRYFEEMLNRVNGERNTTGWNSFNSYKAKSISKTFNTGKNALSDKLDISSMPWLHNSSI